MAHKAKVTTKTGDTGFTGLLGSTRVPKEDSRIEALGAIDEATSALGLARAWIEDPRTAEIVLRVQRDLYILMAELATPAANQHAIGLQITAEQVAWLETTQSGLLAELELPSAFIIPGESQAGAALDLARSVVRRAERRVAQLLHQGLIASGESLRYLNRLSDLLFVLARRVEADAGGSAVVKRVRGATGTQAGGREVEIRVQIARSGDEPV